MKNIFRIITVILITLSVNSYGQSSRLKIETSINENDTSSNSFTIIVSRKNDSTYRDKFENVLENDDVTLDRLNPDTYKIQLFKGQILDEPIITKYVTLLPNKRTIIVLDVNTYETIYDIDSTTKLEKETEKFETQFNLSYLKNNWLNPPSAIKSNYSIGFTQSMWYAFNKHVGFLPGIGIGFGQQYFSKDTTFINAPQFKKNYECYNYLDGHLDMKFRISSGNQQSSNNGSTKMLIDIGAIYNFPFIFKDVARYNDSKRITNSRLHQYTDVRAYVNIGFYPVVVFCEYRIFDFVIGNYPELPRYNAGIKFLLVDTSRRY